MQIVIDIPEEEYKLILSGNVRYFNDYTKYNTYSYVQRGTPLPKGHGRLIEVTNQLEQELFTFTRYTGIDECPYESATLITDNAPTIIETDKAGKEQE